MFEPDSFTRFGGDTELHGCGMPWSVLKAVPPSLVHQGASCYLSQLIEPTAGNGTWGPNDGTATEFEEPRRNTGLGRAWSTRASPKYSR